MPDHRAITLLLVATFLALALGVVVGVAMGGDALLIEQQEALWRELRTEFDRLRVSNERLQRDLDQAQTGLLAATRLAEGLLPLALSGSFSEARVAVVAGADPALAERLAADLALAGADPGRVVEVPPGADLDPRGLAAQVAAPASGGSPAPAPAAVVLLPPRGTARARQWQELAGYLAAAGLPVVVAGGTGDGPDLEPYRALGLSTVGHADTAAGRLSVVWLAAGRATGDFGPGPATALLPDVAGWAAGRAAAGPAGPGAGAGDPPDPPPVGPPGPD